MRFLHYTAIMVLTIFIASCTGEKKEKETKEQKENVEEKNQLKDPKLKAMMDDLNETGSGLGLENLADGYHEIKYPNGKIKAAGTVSNGKKEGIWTYYHEDGTVWSECDFLNGVSNGKVISYHPNGQIYYIGYFTNGVKSGNWMFYDKEGKLIKEENMK